MKIEYNENRKIIHKQGIEVDESDVSKLVSIANVAHKPEMAGGMYADVWTRAGIANVYMNKIDKMNLLMGEDWYLLYFDEGSMILAADFARIIPQDPKHGRLQQRELECAFDHLLEAAVTSCGDGYEVKEIATELREDTSYFLFLMKKRHGIVDQLYTEEARAWGDQKYVSVSEQDQKEFMRNFNPRKYQNDQTMMHVVWFKPSTKTINKILEKRRKPESESQGESV